MVNICLWCDNPIRKETEFTLKNEVHKSCEIKIDKMVKFGLQNGD
jgi:hypothetical protein